MATTLGFDKEIVRGFSRASQPLFVIPSEPKRQVKTNLPENDLVAFCENLFDIGKVWRDQRLGMLDRWRTYRSWYLNAGGTGESASARSLTYVNLIYEKIEKLAADQTDARPEFLYTPHTMQDVQMSDLLNEAVNFIWKSHNMDAEYFHTIKATDLYGTWYWKVLHDPRFGKIGSLEKIVSVPVWNVFCAPYSTAIETCPWMIEISLRTPGQIEQDYGVEVDPEIGATNEIFPDISEDFRRWPSATNITGVDPNASPPGSQSGALVEAIPDTYFGSTAGKTGLVIQKELWIRDGATVPEYWWDDSDGLRPPELKKSQTVKYPGGRCISWANGKLLYDEPNPYKDGRFPYAKFVDISIPDFWFGLGECETLINLQLLHDDTHEIIKQVHLFTALGRLIVDEGTGLNEGSMSNEPGEIWWVKPGTSDRVQWLQGSVPNPEFYTYLSTLERSADLVTGSFDVTRGINPTGVTAGRALSTLQNAANIRIRARLTDIESALITTARLIASRIQQFWPSELSLRVAGRDATEAIEAGPFRFKNYSISPADREASFNVDVSASANLDQLKEAEFQKLLLLFQSGLISPESLLEGANLTSVKKYLTELPLLAAKSQVPTEQGPPAPSAQMAQGMPQ